MLVSSSLLGLGCYADQTEGTVEEVTTIRVQAPKAPPSIPLVPFNTMEGVELNWYQGMDEAMSRMINGEVDISIVPVNSMAILFNKGVDIQLGAVTTWGILYLVSSYDSFIGWHDLKGQTVGVGARGFSPDLVFRSLLEKNGLNPKDDLELIYGSSPEIAQSLLAGQLTLAVLPEPILTSILVKDSSIKIIMNLEDEWNKAFPESAGLPQAGLAISKEFAANHPDLLQEFYNNYSLNLQDYLQHPEIVGSNEEGVLSLPAGVIKQSLQRSNLKFVHAEEAAQSVDQYLQVIFLLDPDAVGGVVPDLKSDFYLRD